MRTTFDLPDPLFRQLKAHAALRGLKMRELVVAALTAALQGQLPQPERLDVPKPTPTAAASTRQARTTRPRRPSPLPPPAAKAQSDVVAQPPTEPVDSSLWD